MINKSNESFKNIHPTFRWQGQKLNEIEIMDLAEEYCKSSEAYLQDIGKFFIDWFNDNPLIEVQTSGSTGTPKKMLVKKQYMINSARATETFFNLPPGTTALLCLPATYIAGKLMLVRALMIGWEIDSVKPQAKPLDIRNSEYDFCAVTPYQLEKSLDKLELVSKIMVGGGAVSHSLRERLERLSTKVYETYAMTETLTHIAARHINSSQQEILPFKLLKDVQIEQDNRECLVIKAPKVSDETIYTNDIVDIKNLNEFWLKGRYDNIINSGGIKIQPEKVENKLAKNINQRFFITGLSDNSLGEKVVLFIEDKFSQLKLDRLEKAINQNKEIDRYEQPKNIYFVWPFEETHSGKVQRQKTIKKGLEQKNNQ